MGEVEYVVEEQCCSLTSRQTLQGCHEGKTDPLSLLCGMSRILPEPEACIADRLDPFDRGVGRLGKRSGCGRRAVAHGISSRPAATETINAQVGGDAIHPTLKGAPGLEGVKTLPRSEQRVLKRLLGVGAGAQHPVAVTEKTGSMSIDQRRKRNRVARPSTSQGWPYFGGLARHLSHITAVTHCMTRSGLEILR